MITNAYAYYANIDPTIASRFAETLHFILRFLMIFLDSRDAILAHFSLFFIAFNIDYNKKSRQKNIFPILILIQFPVIMCMHKNNNFPPTMSAAPLRMKLKNIKFELNETKCDCRLITKPEISSFRNNRNEHEN